MVGIPKFNGCCEKSNEIKYVKSPAYCLNYLTSHKQFNREVGPGSAPY